MHTGGLQPTPEQLNMLRQIGAQNQPKLFQSQALNDNKKRLSNEVGALSDRLMGNSEVSNDKSPNRFHGRSERTPGGQDHGYNQEMLDYIRGLATKGKAGGSPKKLTFSDEEVEKFLEIERRNLADVKSGVISGDIVSFID
jgi:hypothetical protein